MTGAIGRELSEEEGAAFVADMDALGFALEGASGGTAIACTVAFALAHVLDLKGILSRELVATTVEHAIVLAARSRPDDAQARQVALDVAAVLRGDHRGEAPCP